MSEARRASCRTRGALHLARALALAGTSAFAAAANADQGGVSFWVPGTFGSYAAVPGSPGWSMPVQGYFYNGSAGASEPIRRGDRVAFGLDSRVSLMTAQPTYSPDSKVLGGQFEIGASFGYGRNVASADVSVSPQSGTEIDRSDSVWGWSDIAPIASLAWTNGVHNWMTYVTGNVPVGAYDSSRLANIGIGHAAVDAGGGYTYFDPKTGREFSAVAGVTYNFENSSTQYRNGVDSHLDWAASQAFPNNWAVGIAGYVFYQLTGDSGAGAILGPFKSRVAALGPQLGYSFTVNGQPASFSLRGYWEFWAQNRLEGRALFAVLSIPLGSKPAN